MKAGWKIVKLGHIGVHVKGSSMPTKESRFESWSVPSFETGQPEIVNGSSILAAKTPVEVGDVLICKINPRINRVWRVTETGNNLPRICSTEWVVFRANNPSEVLPQWVQIYCSSPTFREWITGQITGTTGSHARAKPSNIFDQEIPLPPLAEQKRIVALLDEAFAGIDDAKAKAEACELSALNLFKSRMQDVFNGHNQAWAKKRLADVADFKNGLNFTRQSNGHTLQMVGVGDFQDRSIVPTQALQSVTIDGNIPDEYLLRRNDILTVRSNGSKDLVGRCMLVPELSAPTSFSGFIIRIRLDTSAVSPRFFLHFMKSSGTRDRLMRVGGGANISNINQAKLSELPVALPPLAQQEEIADQLDGHHELSLILANQYRQKIAAIDSLRTSALQRAFAGELTA